MRDTFGRYLRSVSAICLDSLIRDLANQTVAALVAVIVSIAAKQHGQKQLGSVKASVKECGGSSPVSVYLARM